MITSLQIHDQVNSLLRQAANGIKLTGIDERRLAVEADRAHESALRSQCPVFQKAGG